MMTNTDITSSIFATILCVIIEMQIFYIRYPFHSDFRKWKLSVTEAGHIIVTTIGVTGLGMINQNR